MGESASIMRRASISERSVSERAARGGSRADRAVAAAVEGITFKNLEPDERINIRYAEHNIPYPGRPYGYRIGINQALNARNKDYFQISFGGGPGYMYDSIDLSKMTLEAAREHIRKEMVKYIRRSERWYKNPNQEF